MTEDEAIKRLKDAKQKEDDDHLEEGRNQEEVEKARKDGAEWAMTTAKPSEFAYLEKSLNPKDKRSLLKSIDAVSAFVTKATGQQNKVTNEYAHAFVEGALLFWNRIKDRVLGD